MRSNDQKNFGTGDYRLRDIAAIVAMAGNFLLVIGWIGKFYVDSYRLTQLEKTAEERRVLFNSLQIQLNQHLNFAEGKVKEFDTITDRVNACCPLYKKER